MRITLFLPLLLIFSIALAAPQESHWWISTDQKALKPAIIPFEILAEGHLNQTPSDADPEKDTITDSEAEKARLVIIQNESDWDLFLAAHPHIKTPKPFDFTKKMLIAVIDSDQPNGGYSLKIDRIEQKQSRLHVYAVRRQPDSSCLNLGMISRPFMLVSIPHLNIRLPASLSLSTQTSTCQ